MTKLEKIEEMIREYHNGTDLTADELIKGIENVIFDERSFENNLAVSTPAGKLIAAADEYNQSVTLMLEPEGGEGAVIDLTYAEVKRENIREITDCRKDVSVYTFENPSTEQWTRRFDITRESVVKALEIDDLTEIMHFIADGHSYSIGASSIGMSNGNSDDKCYYVESSNTKVFKDGEEIIDFGETWSGVRGNANTFLDSAFAAFTRGEIKPDYVSPVLYNSYQEITNEKIGEVPVHVVNSFGTVLDLQFISEDSIGYINDKTDDCLLLNKADKSMLTDVSAFYISETHSLAESLYKSKGSLEYEDKGFHDYKENIWKEMKNERSSDKENR